MEHLRLKQMTITQIHPFSGYIKRKCLNMVGSSTTIRMQVDRSSQRPPQPLGWRIFCGQDTENQMFIILSYFSRSDWGNIVDSAIVASQ